jgi:hypothetical protein
VRDYTFNDRDLRVKKDVSDLKLDPLFWRRVLRKNHFFASYRIHPSAAVRPVCGALLRQLQGQSVFELGSVFVHGLCATNLSRESARHRGLCSCALRSTIPSGLPQPFLSQYSAFPLLPPGTDYLDTETSVRNSMKSLRKMNAAILRPFFDYLPLRTDIIFASGK